MTKLNDVVDQVFREHPNSVREAKNKVVGAQQFLVGQTLKLLGDDRPHDIVAILHTIRDKLEEEKKVLEAFPK
jgi:Asp-tRNA(Asn)/Glu-tRNA(Gln) amidotransferase B subunit